MAKTIKQIADEIGVSKQTVYKRYKGKLYTVCAPYAHTEQGVLYIEEQGETLIKQDFLQKECSIGAHTERSNGAVLEQSENAGVVAVLQTTIDTLQGQLAIKDKQIEELNARLAEVSSALVAAQQTAQAAQALHAGTIQQQLTSGADLSDGSGNEMKNQDGLVGGFAVRQIRRCNENEELNFLCCDEFYIGYCTYRCRCDGDE